MARRRRMATRCLPGRTTPGARRHHWTSASSALTTIWRFFNMCMSSIPASIPCAAMILFDDIVEILDLADSNRGAVLRIVALDGRFIGRITVDGDLLGHAVTADRFGQEALHVLLIALFG